MSGKWTPGPWALSIKEFGEGEITKPGDDLDNPWHIAETFGGCAVNNLLTEEEESEANARLIAAAPELYEALEWAMAFIDPACVNPEGHEKATAVLAKARGETL